MRYHGHSEQQFLENWLSSLDDKNQNNTSMSAEKYRQQLDLEKKQEVRIERSQLNNILQLNGLIC